MFKETPCTAQKTPQEIVQGLSIIWPTTTTLFSLTKNYNSLLPTPPPSHHHTPPQKQNWLAGRSKERNLDPHSLVSVKVLRASERVNRVCIFSQARLDSTSRVIRAREERVSLRRVERQFMSMAVVILFVVGLVLLINTVTIYQIGDFVHEAEVYFTCLQVRNLTPGQKLDQNFIWVVALKDFIHRIKS